MPSASPPPSQPPSPSPSPPPSPSRRWGGLREASAHRERAQSSAGSLSQRGPAGEGEADGAAVTSRAVQSQLFERTGSSTALLLADRGPRRDRRRPGLVLEQLTELIRLVAAVGVLLLEVAFVATLAYYIFFLVAVLPARAALASWRRIVAGLAGEDLTWIVH